MSEERMIVIVSKRDSPLQVASVITPSCCRFSANADSRSHANAPNVEATVLGNQ
jgi:hypothetical protein